LTDKLNEVTHFMGKQMLEFTNCVAEVVGETASHHVSVGVKHIESLSDDNMAAATAQIEEFRDSPDTEALHRIILPQPLEGAALDQLLRTVQGLDDAMRSNRQYCNGLYCYTVRRPTALLPDKVMWLCQHHKRLMEQWDSRAINEEQLLERVEDPAKHEAGSAAPSSSSPVVQLAPQLLTALPSSSPGIFPRTFPPELKRLTSQDVATRIKSIAPAYEQYYQTFVEQCFDGEVVASYAGKSHSELSQELVNLGIKLNVQRVKIISEIEKFFDHRTFQPFADARVVAATSSTTCSVRGPLASRSALAPAFAASFLTLSSMQENDVLPRVAVEGQDSEQKQSRRCCSTM
jgi:hypothetical protein